VAGELELLDWRRQVAELYAAVRAEADPSHGHQLWRVGRDRLFRSHPQSPLPAQDRLRHTGLPYWPYDPALRFELALRPAPGAGRRLAGGIFLPLRDGSAGTESYGGGRYALDTSKGADLGGDPDHLVVDLNFLYHPSCRYDDRWLCPLAPAGNTITTFVAAGECLQQRS
jgi:uncharacterized protein (DUF1684 family)